MSEIHIIVGSVLGASEYVADAISERLASEGLSNEIHLQPNLVEIPHRGIWIICSSTHGAGELPDNIQDFAKALETVRLEKLPYLVFSLGDSSYDTFCQGGATLDRLLAAAGASQIIQPLEIDVLQHPIPEDYAIEWLDKQIPLLKDRLEDAS